MDRLRPEVIVPLSRRPRLLIALFGAVLMAPTLMLFGVPWRGHAESRVKVRVETTPPGAFVQMGSHVMHAPCTIEVSRHWGDLTLSMPGYQDTVVRIAPKGGNARVRAVLVPAAK